ncbi:MAG: OmpA family protein [Haliscomenobacter sp.]|nr:OmpA family protein [Haliscomenobacter sp.]
MTWMRYYLFIWLWVLFSGALAAQSRLELGVWGGGAGYLGDLTPFFYPAPAEVQPAYGLLLRMRQTPAWSFRFQALYGGFRGDDRQAEPDNGQRRRNFSFQSQFGELSAAVEWDPWAYLSKEKPMLRSRCFVAPVIVVGVGAMYLKAEPRFGLQDDQPVPPAIQRDLDVKSPLILPGITMGGLWNLPLGRSASLFFHVNSHYQWTDRLDGISHSGNPKARDWLLTAGTGLSFRFQPKDSDRDGFADKEDACPRLAGSPSARGCPDRDGDGVEDAEDACPDQPGLAEYSGCADSDGDGIMDKADQCPFAFGYEDTHGCPDRDNDCVIDSLDACPDAEGLLVFDGCPDSDFDSIPDPEDPCPLEAGLREHGGCPLPDSDCDGIVDAMDLCPHTPDTIGFTGCPDSDGDGWIDPEDCCPNEPGIDSLQGCPELKAEEKKLLEKAMKEVRFKTGSAILLTDSRKILDQIVVLVRNYPAFSLDIRGHTDSQGKAESNLILSRKRAQACFDYLVQMQVPSERIRWEGYGETLPIRDNRTPQGRAINRRVEFELILAVDSK